jgi:outer membrane protein assembly factor BamB
MLARGRSVVFVWALALVVFIGLLGSGAGAQTNAASITLTPPSGPAGSTTTVAGQGFGSNEIVILGFDVIAVGSAMTDATGAFSKAIQVPKGARTGAHQVFARGQVSKLFASATFTVTLVDWPTFRFEPAHSGFNPYENILNPNNVASLSLSWIGNGFGPGLVFHSSPAVVKGLAYIGSDDGNLYVFNANGCGQPNCSPVWTGPLGQSIFSAPAVDGGFVFVASASSEGKLAAFKADGCGQPFCQPIWTATLSGTESSPVVVNGILYVGAFDGNMYAFKAAGCGSPVCQPIWRGRTGGYIESSPAVSGGVVYVGSSDHLLYAFNAKGCPFSTCPPKWVGQVGGSIFASSPTISNGVVYVGSFEDGKLNAFNANGCGQPTCQPMWKGNAAQYVESSPAVANGLAYIGAGDGMLYVFNANGCGQPSCQPVWRAMASGPVSAMNSSPTIANGVLYVGENQGRIYAFNANGCGQPVCQQLWEFITQDPIVNSSPTLVNGTLYVGGSNFGSVPELYVFKLFSP